MRHLADHLRNTGNTLLKSGLFLGPQIFSSRTTIGPRATGWTPLFYTNGISIRSSVYFCAPTTQRKRGQECRGGRKRRSQLSLGHCSALVIVRGVDESVTFGRYRIDCWLFAKSSLRDTSRQSAQLCISQSPERRTLSLNRKTSATMVRPPPGARFWKWTFTFNFWNIRQFILATKWENIRAINQKNSETSKISKEILQN